VKAVMRVVSMAEGGEMEDWWIFSGS